MSTDRRIDVTAHGDLKRVYLNTETNALEYEDASPAQMERIAWMLGHPREAARLGRPSLWSSMKSFVKEHW